MNGSHRVLILSFSHIARDPRVMRQVRLLQSRVQLVVAGFGVPPETPAGFVNVEPKRSPLARKLNREARLLAGLLDAYYWMRPEVTAALHALASREFDLVIANDVPALPLALRIAKDAPVLFDAHEYSPTEFEDRLVWRLRVGRLYSHICRRYLPQTAAVTTVCQGIAEEYERNFGVHVSVIENAAERQQLVPRPMEHGHIRMIHHGAAIRSRRLESMIELVGMLDRQFSLDFMLVGNDAKYLDELRERASGEPRIRFLPPVEMSQICAATNAYDIGLFLLPPVNFNYRFALPNKLFEFIQARLAVAVGPSPEMARIVRDYGLGVVSESFEPASMAQALGRLTEQDIARHKEAAHLAADKLCFEAAGERLLKLVSDLLAGARPATRCTAHPAASLLEGS